MQNTSSDDELDALYQALKSIVTHPKFEDVLSEIQRLPPIEGLQVALTQLTPQALADMGVPIPKECTITTRVSQDSTSSTTSAADAAATEQNVAYVLAFVPCVSVGISN